MCGSELPVPGGGIVALAVFPDLPCGVQMVECNEDRRSW